jgi:LPXTG-motif cell wall-anchored protein
MLKWIGVGILCLVLSTGCLTTKVLFPGGTELTVTESNQLETIKDTVVAVSTGVSSVLVPGGAGGTALLAAFGAWYWRRKRSK